MEKVSLTYPPPLPASRRKPGLPVLIGIAGGPSAGKGSVCKAILKKLESLDSSLAPKVAIISMTSFYRTFSKEEIELAQLGKFDFGNLEKAHPLDHPSAFDIDFMERVIQCMSEGQFVELPCYDFKTFQRLPTTVPLQPPDVVIFVGMYTLFSKIMREQFSLRVFVDVDSDVRMSRQVLRDTEERYKLPLERVLDRYVRYSKPAYEEFIFPTKKYADVIIPRGIDNQVAIDLLGHHLHDLLTGHEYSVESLQKGTGILYNGGDAFVEVAH